MPYKFKKNQRVKFTHNIDFTTTGGPFIPKGTTGTILKRRRDTNIVWLKSDDFGIHAIRTNYLEAA